MLANTLALSAGRALQKKQTGFVHYCRESDDLKTHDTIPSYENALFALALFRSRLSEQVLEGKTLIEKLLAFELDGNFPTYLHEYPLQNDPYLGLRLLPVFYWLTIDFGHIMGKLKQELKVLIERIIVRAEKLDLPNWAEGRIQAIRGEPYSFLENLDEGLLSLQIAEKNGVGTAEMIKEACRLWHPDLQLYVGPAQRRNQFGTLPEVTLYDLFMSSWQKRFSERVSKMHPIHLKGALIRPLPLECSFEEKNTPWIHFDPSEEMPLWVAWDQHTLVLSKKHLLRVEGSSEEMLLYPREQEEMEVNFYLNHHPDHDLKVDGQKASIIRMGQSLQIQSKGVRFDLSFTSEEGLYCGHLMRGNRPCQHLCRGEHLYESYDWRIAIRTITAGSSPLRVRLQSEPSEKSFLTSAEFSSAGL